MIDRKDLPNLWINPNLALKYKTDFQHYESLLLNKEEEWTKDDWEFISKFYNKIGEIVPILKSNVDRFLEIVY